MISIDELKRLLAPYGELRSQGVTEWKGEIELPKTIAAFYEDIGPWGNTYHDHIGPVGSTISVGGNPVCIPPLCKLWEIQSGYRWHANTGERLNDWLDHWLVIAQEGSNPFIFDINSEKILFDLTGGGKWQPKEVAPNLATAIAAFATIANVHDELEDAAYDKSFETTPAYRSVVVERLCHVFDSRQAALHFLNTWEYDGIYV